MKSRVRTIDGKDMRGQRRDGEKKEAEKKNRLDVTEKENREEKLER